jgi:saccharopine dehydrogenase-like NADP-dependent oxidoreductase
MMFIKGFFFLPYIDNKVCMKHILVLGAGKSSTVLIEYLLSQATTDNWHIHVADVQLALAQTKTGNHPRASCSAIDPNDDNTTDALIARADLVISLLPPHLHLVIAKKCLSFGKHFLNASYVSAEMKELDAMAKAKGLTFLCEMGLDPGIDHMSAMEIMDGIRSNGGSINSFRSHCGGLIAPESDDNPWHYKISWNPRNIILAGKDGAAYRENGKDINIDYSLLFDPARKVDVPGMGPYAWYPNRDSLSYIDTYHLEGIQTFIRTTLRHPDFCFGWKNLVDLKLTDESVIYDTDGMTLSAFFQIHFDRFGFSEWLQETLSARFKNTKDYLENLIHIIESEHTLLPEGKTRDEFLIVDEKGSLQDMSMDAVKTETASGIASQMHEANLSLTQLFFLGLDSDEMINKGRCSAADILQWVIEKKLALKTGDKDMIIMLHEIGYTVDGQHKSISSSLVVKGKDEVHTAMAQTVGLPLGIAAKLIVTGEIQMHGVLIPIHKEIYEKVLPELEKNGIVFHQM